MWLTESQLRWWCHHRPRQLTSECPGCSGGEPELRYQCNWCGPLFKQNCKQSQNSESNPDTLINGNPCCMKVHLQSHAPVFVFSSTHKIVSQDEQQRFGKERPRSCKSKDPVSANTVAPQKWLQGSMIPTRPLPGFPEP